MPEYHSARRALVRLVAGFGLSVMLSACALTQSQSFWASDRVAELSRALGEQDFKAADRLISRNSGVLSPEKALDIGIREGSLEVVNHYLLEADVNKSLDLDGVTPLIRAVQSAPDRQREPIVRRLLEAGADPLLTDNFGRSAVNYANFSGNPTLARFLESGGTAFYRSGPAQRIEWLPELDWSKVVAAGKSRSKPARTGVLSRSPLRVSATGRPDLLFASTWLPDVFANDATSASYAGGPFAGLRFHADGTGDVMRYSPAERSIAAGAPAHLAWTLQRDGLVFVVLTTRYASYCQSTNDAAGRVGVACTDYSTRGGNLEAVLAGGLSNASARQLLDSSVQRSRLVEVGQTRSVLTAAADRLCKPIRASAKLREGLPANAADPKSFGDWVVFDAARFSAWPSSDTACTQRDARTTALRNCRNGGARCRSVGGCTAAQATAVASVEGHDWATLACNPDIERAKQEALAECRARAGCDCQIVYANQIMPDTTPASCRRSR